MKWNGLLMAALCTGVYCRPSDVRVRGGRSTTGTLTTGMTWANFAWGNISSDIEDADGVSLVLIDPDRTTHNANTFRSLGQTVVCYMSAGTVENWRSDKTVLQQYVSEVSGYSGEAWLDITRWEEFKHIMAARMDRDKTLQCDAIELDNVDCFVNKCVDGQTTESLRKYEAAYLKWLASTAHSKGLLVGLKNAVSLISEVGDDFDFAINESCTRFDECSYYKTFKNENKAVLAVEYTASGTLSCAQAEKYGLSMKYKSGNVFVDC